MQKGLFYTTPDPFAAGEPGNEVCVKFAQLKDKMSNQEDPWANVSPVRAGGTISIRRNTERKAIVLNVAPKVADEPMVTEVLVQFLKQFNYEMQAIVDSCGDDFELACADFNYMLERMAADPPIYLPIEIEDALLYTMPEKVTPLMLKMFWDAYFEECAEDLEALKKACSGECEEDCGIPCTEFEVFNGKVEFDGALTEATLTCDRGYKAITGDTQVDLMTASSTATVTCRTKDGTWGEQTPGCYACEYGWEYSESLPACYRVFRGLSPYTHVPAYRKHCLSHKGDLASVHSEEEMLFLTGLIDRGSALIGYNMDETSGEEIWTDGTPYTFSQWVEGIDDQGTCAAIATDGEGNFGL